MNRNEDWHVMMFSQITGQYKITQDLDLHYQVTLHDVVSVKERVRTVPA
jgi:hypothetical protein